MHVDGGSIAHVCVALITGFAAVPSVFGQHVTLVNEQVISSQPIERGPIYRGWVSARLSLDGKTLLYGEPVGKPSVPDQPRSARRAQLVIRRLDTAGAKPTQFRPDIGPSSPSDLNSLLLGAGRTQPFSPNGKLLLLYEFTGGSEPPGWEKKRPILVCEIATGRVARTDIHADLRFGRIDTSNRLLLYRNGQAFSLETGKRVKQFTYIGFIEAANPVAPLALVNTGIEGTPDTPNRVIVWNLREDRLLATLPTNFEEEATDDVLPEWTSDGTYVYFLDSIDAKDPHEPRVTKVWNVKTGQLVGAPFREAIPMGPGPLPGTMVLRQQRGEGAAYVLHHADSGARAELPLEFGDIEDAASDKVAYVKKINGEPHLCIATVMWDLPTKPAGRERPKAPTR